MEGQAIVGNELGAGRTECSKIHGYKREGIPQGAGVGEVKQGGLRKAGRTEEKT